MLFIYNKFSWTKFSKFVYYVFDISLTIDKFFINIIHFSYIITICYLDCSYIIIFLFFSIKFMLFDGYIYFFCLGILFNMYISDTFWNSISRRNICEIYVIILLINIFSEIIYFIFITLFDIIFFIKHIYENLLNISSKVFLFTTTCYNKWFVIFIVFN